MARPAAALQAIFAPHCPPNSVLRCPTTPRPCRTLHCASRTRQGSDRLNTPPTSVRAALEEERAENAWVEGVAIWVAVILVSMVGSVNDYQKELQFRKLNAEKDSIQVKVIRGGKEQLVPNTEIVVGDLMALDTGDKVVADGVEVSGHGLVIDEASLTGESDAIKKLPDGDFWIRSGSQVRAAARLGAALGGLVVWSVARSGCRGACRWLMAMATCSLRRWGPTRSGA